MLSLTSEPLFTTFSATPQAPAAANAAALNISHAAFQEAPKLDNNDLLLENLDLNLMLSHPAESSPSHHSESFVIDGDLFDSVFKHPEDPLTDPSATSTEDIDAELKGMFDFVEPVVTVKAEDGLDLSMNMNMNMATNDEVAEDIFKTFELEQRAHSTVPVSNSSLTFAPSPPSNKRSFSVAGLDSSSSSSSASASASTSQKKDKLGCTPYTRKQRSSPLPPVVAKGDDTASQKRARNTEAARRSRARKMERMAQLEDKCEGLIQENEALKRQVAELKAQLGI